MSFHEKSAWACLGAILFVYVPFFGLAFSTPGYPIVIAAFNKAIVALVSILIGIHIAFALFSKRIRETGDVPPPDELEVAIELQATKIASYVLGSVVIVWCLAAYAGIPISGAMEAGLAENAALAAETVEQAESTAPTLTELLPIPAEDALFFVNLMFAGIVLANVVYYASMVVSYRRAA